MSEDQHMGNLYQRFPVTIERGVGAHVWDIEGKEYVDCMGGYGVALVGHQNQRVNNAIKEQVDKIITVHSSLYNKTREGFLKKLIEIAPKGLTQVHLNNSGAEAVEAAMKFARKFTGKKGMVAMKGSYHGKSFGALSLTFNPKYRKAFAPLVEKVSFASFGDMDSLRSVIDEDTAFIILEPIQGESGIVVAPDGFLQEVRKLCDEKGILLVFDEIQAGLGRTGQIMGRGALEYGTRYFMPCKRNCRRSTNGCNISQTRYFSSNKQRRALINIWRKSNIMCSWNCSIDSNYRGWSN